MPRKKARGPDLSEAAHNVWLAGLGAFATAGQEGEKLFHTLVSRGRKFEKTSENQVEKAGAAVRDTVKEVRRRTGKTLGGIQAAIDDGVTSALHRLGVPTRDEIAALSKKVEKLTRAVNGRGTAKRTPRRAKRQTAKSAD